MAIPYMTVPLIADTRDAVGRRLTPSRRYAKYLLPNLVDNGDFEDTDNPDEADQWRFSTDVVSGSFVQMLGASQAHYGSSCVRLYAENRGYARITSDDCDWLQGFDHKLSIWYYWDALSGTDTSLTLRITYTTGSGTASVDIALPSTGGPEWKEYTTTLAASSTYTGFSLRLTCDHAGLSGSSDVWVDDIVIHPCYSANSATGFDFDYDDFSALTAGSALRYDFPYCPQSHDVVIDDPVDRTRAELGDLFQLSRRSDLRSYVMNYPSLSEIYAKLLRQFYRHSRGQEITFHDWNGDDHTVYWPGPWSAPTDIDAVAPVGLTLEEVEAGVREELRL